MSLTRRRFLGLALAAGSVAVGGVDYSLAEARRFVVSRHRRVLGGLETPVRVAHLSDLHFGRFHGVEALRGWVDAALREKPDLVLVTGDIANGPITRAAEAALAAELGRLAAPLGAYAVLGNHDYFWREGSRARGVWAMVERLEAAGLAFLVNRGLPVRPDLYLAGVDDLWHGRPDLSAALAGAPGGGARLLMSHNPDLLPEVPDAVGLTLCGHTHGGQVKLPGLALVYEPPSRYGWRFAEGFVAGGKGFVSRGLGTTGPPVRVNCPAELVVLDLIPG